MAARTETKRLLDEATLGCTVDLLDLQTYNASLEDVDELLQKALHESDLKALHAQYALPLSFGPRSSALKGVDPSSVLEGIDPSLRSNRGEMACLDDKIRAELRVPIGHTPYSWYGKSDKTPTGHTAYSSPPVHNKHPLLALKDILVDVRAYEKGRAFHKFLLRGVAGLQGGEYSKR